MTDTPKTVRCLIALAVSPHGTWGASGNADRALSQSLQNVGEYFARGPLGYHIVEVDVPVPTVPVIQAEATPAEER